MQESEVKLAEDRFQQEKAQIDAIWQQRIEQYQQAVQMQVSQGHR